MKSIIYYYENRYIELNVNPDANTNEKTNGNEPNVKFSPVINPDGSISVQGKKLEMFQKTQVSDTCSVMLFENTEEKDAAMMIEMYHRLNLNFRR